MAYWDDPADEQANVPWVRDLRAAMGAYTTGTYVNFVDADLTDGDGLLRRECRPARGGEGGGRSGRRLSRAAEYPPPDAVRTTRSRSPSPTGHRYPGGSRWDASPMMFHPAARSPVTMPLTTTRAPAARAWTRRASRTVFRIPVSCCRARPQHAVRSQIAPEGALPSFLPIRDRESGTGPSGAAQDNAHSPQLR